jgi:hypothetical protein
MAMRFWRNRASPSGKAARAFVAAALLLLTAVTARALDFQCVEPSRYKNLLPVFNDDPNVFFSYFGLPRGRLPDMDSCRSLLITGTLQPGDADALLERIIQGKGWLALLHLSFQGSELEEEARMSAMVREFSLKTRAIQRSTELFYAPDFAMRWETSLSLTETSAAAAAPGNDITPLQRGMKAFLDRRDRALKLDPARSNCNDGCRTVFHAGVNRLLFAPPAGGPEPTHTSVPGISRQRVAMAYQIETSRVPEANAAVLNKPLQWGTMTPSATARMLRDKCNPEFTVAETLEGRLADSFETAARNNLRPREVAALAASLDALNRAGARLQQCLAAALESERLAAFQKQCPSSCDKRALSTSYANKARELVERAGRL